jgi:hypothetical protein
VRGLIVAVAASIPGILAGIAVWTVVAVCLLLVYWVGYELLYLGLLCGSGKLGLGWFVPPSQSAQKDTREWALFLTALAFTFGEILAGVLGAFFGGVAGLAGMRLLYLLRRLRRRERSDHDKLDRTS